MSTRFAVAVHILAVLRYHQGSPISSELIAASVNTNPVVVRRILSQLKRAGLVEAQLGSGGGFLLAHEPEDINLEQVFRAVEEDWTFPTHREPPSCECLVGRNVVPVLETITARASQAMLDELSAVSIEEIAKKIGARERRSR
jgi:Rrf2 family protein